MTQSSKRRNIYVGIFVSIATIFFVCGIFLIGNINDTFSSKFEIVSFFDDVRGLKKGDNVWFSGVKIGTVSELSFRKHSKVAVTLNIQKDTKQFIRKNAKVKLGSDGLIGNKILIIYGGTENASFISEGDTIQSVVTLSSEEVLNMLQKNNDNILKITGDLKIITGNMKNGVGTAGKILTDDSLYLNFMSLTNSLKASMQKAELMMSNLNEVAMKLNEEGTFFNDVISDTSLFNSLQYSFDKLEVITDSTEKIISNFKSLSENNQSSFGVLTQDEQAGRQLKETIKNLESSSKRLDEDLEALQHNFLLRRYFKKKAKNSDEN